MRQEEADTAIHGALAITWIAVIAYTATVAEPGNVLFGLMGSMAGLAASVHAMKAGRGLGRMVRSENARRKQRRKQPGDDSEGK